MHLTRPRFLHELGHFADERERVDRLAREGNEAAVEFSDIAKLVDDRDDPRAGLLRPLYHFPLTCGERRIAIALEHPQISADDAGRRAEFVDRERQQPRVSDGKVELGIRADVPHRLSVTHAPRSPAVATL